MANGKTRIPKKVAKCKPSVGNWERLMERRLRAILAEVERMAKKGAA